MRICDLNFKEIFDKGVTMVSEELAIEDVYSGTYTDIGSRAEREMLTKLKQGDWRKIVREYYSDSNPWLYKIITDTSRSVFLDTLDVNLGGTYLDVGSGWGQIAIPLSTYGAVVALDLTRNRLEILKEIARQEGSNLFYVQGNFLTVPFMNTTFDLIVFNGSLEWIGVGRKQGDSIHDVQSNALQKACRLLKPGGQIYIGIENSLGLKYLLGAADDHIGLPYTSFLGEYEAQDEYSQHFGGKQLPAKTWSLGEYKDLLQNAGLELENIYACFPDYKTIKSMINIKHLNRILLEQGIDYQEHDGTNGQDFGRSIQLKALYHSLAYNGIAQYFCPSYGIVARKGW